MDRRAQGLSINTIIIAAISIIVMVILIYLVLQAPTGEANKCSTVPGAHCVTEIDSDGAFGQLEKGQCPEGEVRLNTYTCEAANAGIETWCCQAVSR